MIHLLATLTTAAPTVCLQPLGRYDRTLLDGAARGVRTLYGFPVQILEPLSFPASAWTAPRSRWRADRVLDWLHTAHGPTPEADVARARCDVLIGFTSEDISTTKEPYADWGVFGLGEIDGRTAAVSTHRLGGGRTPQTSRHRRTVKVTNHEIGHVLGVPHVRGEGCLMNDAEGSVRTVDAETGLLCAPTRAFIEGSLGIALPEHEAYPWGD